MSKSIVIELLDTIKLYTTTTRLLQEQCLTHEENNEELGLMVIDPVWGIELLLVWNSQ